MCDTFFIPKEKSSSGKNILAKNSDREPNEAQQIQRFSSSNRENNIVNCTFISIPFLGKTHEIIVSKPFQMWGVEMGVNEFGLAIGNEAVFTKIKPKKTNNGLTGMDMNRLVLETCKTAKEGLEYLIFLLKKYGQDACGGYLDKEFFYDNSFLIADAQEAYVLETAGQFWVYQKVKGFRAISNCLSIETEFDGIDPTAQDFAIKKGWIKRAEKFSFAKAFSAPFMTTMAKGWQRKNLCESKQYNNEKIGLFEVFQILRSHKDEEKFHPFKCKMNSLCLHASGILTPSQTTGSLVVELENRMESPIWLTGSAAPCLAVFKPFYFGSTILDEPYFNNPSAYNDTSYWWQWETWHRMALKKYDTWINEFSAERNDLEVYLMEASKSKNSTSEQSILSKRAIERSLVLMERWKSKIICLKDPKQSLGYKFLWNKLNKKIRINL